jgi:endonuclease-8
MPEGDTLHRAARRLRPALVGGDLVRFEAPHLRGDRPRTGELVTGVEAVGKHLLIEFSGGLILRTHLGMAGSWRLFEQGQRWTKPRHLLRALVVVPGWEAVCFSAPQVQIHREDPVGHLGPDLCTPDPDLDEVLRRFAAAPPDIEIGVALLDQRLASGIGNVYKSEVLHRCRVDPFAPLATVPEPVRRQLLSVANRLLLHNLTTSRRTTAVGPPGALAVYGRARRPCPACGTPVRMARQGPQARSTYWCPRCQPSSASATAQE